MTNKQDFKEFTPINSSDTSKNFKTLIGKFLGYLPYYILSIIISFLIAFMVNRYSSEKYLVKGYFLIKEKGGSHDQKRRGKAKKRRGKAKAKRGKTKAKRSKKEFYKECCFRPVYNWHRTGPDYFTR